jgi:hypothetical protein
MLLLTGMSFANSWYNGKLDLKIPVMGGIATAVLAMVNNIPGASGVTQGLAWVAFVGFLIGNVQSPSPVQNIMKIVSP